MKNFLITLLTLSCVITARAQMHTKLVEYRDGDATLEGYEAYDDSIIKGKRPAVLVVHQWMGLTDYEKGRAEMLAKLGYNVFAVDIYGKGVRPKDTKEAGTLAGKYKADRELMRRRVNAGLRVLEQDPLTDTKKVAAIGYCFGGTTVIELALSGADVNGVVSFHGGLDAPKPEDAKNIKCKVLELARSGADIAGVVCFHGGLDSPKPDEGKNIKCKVLVLHGADDPMTTPKDMAAFQEEMKKAKVDWQLVLYGGAVHSFTQKDAGSDNSKGAAYNEQADLRSWAAMQQFFGEIFH